MRAVIRRPAYCLLYLGAMLLTASCGAASTSAVTYATYSVTCCQSSDIDQLYHPGETLVLHWIVSPGPPTSSHAPTRLTLSASLDGAFGSVADLKGGSPAADTPRAASVTTTDRSPTVPNSVIQLPADLAPGYYNLVFKIAAAGNSFGGASVIQITGQPANGASPQSGLGQKSP